MPSYSLMLNESEYNKLRQHNIIVISEKDWDSFVKMIESVINDVNNNTLPNKKMLAKCILDSWDELVPDNIFMFPGKELKSYKKESQSHINIPDKNKFGINLHIQYPNGKYTLQDNTIWFELSNNRQGRIEIPSNWENTRIFQFIDTLNEIL